MRLNDLAGIKKHVGERAYEEVVRLMLKCSTLMADVESLSESLRMFADCFGDDAQRRAAAVLDRHGPSWGSGLEDLEQFDENKGERT